MRSNPRDYGPADIWKEALDLLAKDVGSRGKVLGVNTCSICTSYPRCGAFMASYCSTAFDAPILSTEIYVPPPESPECLMIGLHEVGHVMLKHPNISGLTAPPGTPQRGALEREASEWARAFMEERGTPVPSETWELLEAFWINAGTPGGFAI